MPTNSPPRPERKPPIPHSSYKPSPAKRTRAAFTQLCSVLSKEWDSIRSLNLGVKSGTGVIEDVLITQLQQLANTVHMLAVADADASRVLVQQARRLSTQQFQHLQVLLDMLGLDELSDFLKLMCSSISTASSSRPSSNSMHAGAMRPSTSASVRSAAAASITAALAVGAVSFKSAGSAHDLDHHDASTGSSSRVHARPASRQRRQRAAAGVFELSHAAYPDAPATLQRTMQDEQQQQQQHSGNAHSYGSHHASPEASPPRGLRFAHLLPPGHILVKTAQALKQQQEFEAALAAATPRPTRQQQARVPPLELHQQDQQSHLPPDLLDEALGHLQGYRMGPVSVEGAWQQQQQGSQSDTGAPANSVWPGFGSASMQQSAAGHQHMHTPAQGPWRGSLMAEEAQVCSSSSHVTTAGIPGLCTLDHQQQQQQQHTGAFFLSSYGGQQVQPYSTGLGQLRYQQQQQLLQQQRQNFRAPPVSLQQLWKAGRAATTAAVLDAAHLPVHDSPGDALSLILAPGLVAQRQVQQPDAVQASPSEVSGTGAAASMTRTGTRSRLISRRGSTANNSNSRPNSARNRPGSAVPTLQLQKLEAGGDAQQHGDGVRGSSSSSRPGSAATSSRPSSAVPTSRLGPAHSAAGSVTNRSSMQQG